MPNTLAVATTPAQNICIGPVCPNFSSQADAMNAATRFLSSGIRLFLIIVGLTALFFLLWGGYDYITSEGDKEKVSKAQKKMSYAAGGVILTIVLLTIFGVLAGDVLGILFKDPATGTWGIKLPTLF